MSTLGFSDKINNDNTQSINLNRNYFFTKYINENLINYETSIHFYSEDILFTKYWNKIYLSRYTQNLTNQQQKNFKFNPERASYELLGFYGYGQIILRLNNCSSFIEFKDFTYLYLPSIDTIENVIKDEIYMQNN